MKRAHALALLLMFPSALAGFCNDKPQARSKPIRVLILGGGAEHDFRQCFKQADTTALNATGRFSVNYTEKPDEILPALQTLDALILASNQPLIDPALRHGILGFADSGKGLLLLHPTLAHNWPDWPEFYQLLAGGKAASHAELTPLEVTVLEEKHPAMIKVPASFTLTDELQRLEPEPKGWPIQVLASSEEPRTGKIFPVVWTVKHPKARIVCISLGHDSNAHANTAYQIILRNSLLWVCHRK